MVHLLKILEESLEVSLFVDGVVQLIVVHDSTVD